MFSPGDTAYFVFRGNWINGCYNGHYCLYRGYYPFMPVVIESYNKNSTYGLLYHTKLISTYTWAIHVDCLEKEFSFDKFILAHLEWNKKMTAAQFQSILSTIGR